MSSSRGELFSWFIYNKGKKELAMIIYMISRVTVAQACSVLHAVDKLGLQYGTSDPGRSFRIYVYDSETKSALPDPKRFAKMSGVKKVDPAKLGTHTPTAQVVDLPKTKRKRSHSWKS